MPEETKQGMECTEFEALVSEALDGDGQLSPSRKESFDAHRRVCEVCSGAARVGNILRAHGCSATGASRLRGP